MKRLRCATEASPEDTAAAAPAREPLEEIPSHAALALAPRDAIGVPMQDNLESDAQEAAARPENCVFTE